MAAGSDDFCLRPRSAEHIPQAPVARDTRASILHSLEPAQPGPCLFVRESALSSPQRAVEEARKPAVRAVTACRHSSIETQQQNRWNRSPSEEFPNGLVQTHACL